MLGVNSGRITGLKSSFVNVFGIGTPPSSEHNINNTLTLFFIANDRAMKMSCIMSLNT